MSDEIRRPALYVVATPIGNLGDITLRALDILRGVDIVACEDTRVTARLLGHYQIEKPLLALYRHNELQAGSRVLGALRDAKAVALVSDAGTPVISDPGANFVATVRGEGIPVIPIPGPSALAAAWSVAGFDSTSFLFCGFLPSRPGERRKTLQSLAAVAHALVFYEAPHRVLETVRDLAQLLGSDRKIVVARELTKLFESVHACPLGDVEAWLLADDYRQRGEFVLMVEGAGEQTPQREAAQHTLRVLLEELAPAQSARLAAKLSGVPRNELYEMAVKFKDEE